MASDFQKVCEIQKEIRWKLNDLASYEKWCDLRVSTLSDTEYKERIAYIQTARAIYKDIHNKMEEITGDTLCK